MFSRVQAPVVVSGCPHMNGPSSRTASGAGDRRLRAIRSPAGALLTIIENPQSRSLKVSAYLPAWSSSLLPLPREFAAVSPGGCLPSPCSVSARLLAEPLFRTASPAPSSPTRAGSNLPRRGGPRLPGPAETPTHTALPSAPPARSRRVRPDPGLSQPPDTLLTTRATRQDPTMSTPPSPAEKPLSRVSGGGQPPPP